MANLRFIYRPFLLHKKHCQYFHHLQRNQRDRCHHCRSQNQSRQHGALVRVVLQKVLSSIKLQERRSASTQKAKVKLMRKVLRVLIFELLTIFYYSLHSYFSLTITLSVYFLPLSPRKFLVLTLSTSAG